MRNRLQLMVSKRLILCRAITRGVYKKIELDLVSFFSSSGLMVFSVTYNA
jgi:hypothetical protein